MTYMSTEEVRQVVRMDGPDTPYTVITHEDAYVAITESIESQVDAYGLSWGDVVLEAMDYKSDEIWRDVALALIDPVKHADARQRALDHMQEIAVSLARDRAKHDPWMVITDD